MAGSAAGNLAGDLSIAILNQDDPELVRESLPAYLLLLDSLAAFVALIAAVVAVEFADVQNPDC